MEYVDRVNRRIDLLDNLKIAAVVVGALGLVGGVTAWVVWTDGKEKAAFVDSCQASGRHDRWECLSLWGQSQGSPAMVPMIVPVGK